MDDQAAQAMDDTLARHQALVQALSGEQPMTWEVWKSFAYESSCLTPAGCETSLWAADQLQRALGRDFPARAFNAGHGLMLPQYWPYANDVPWVFANLFELACHFQLFQQGSKELRKSLRQQLTPDNWAHGLMQLEVGGLGKRAGWEVTFEPPLDGGTKADVRLTLAGDALLVETTSMRESDEARHIQQVEHEVGMAISLVAFAHKVHIAGQFSIGAPSHELKDALQRVGAEAAATAQDQRVRHVTLPGGGKLHIGPDSRGAGGVELTGPMVSSDDWGRLQTRLAGKALQAAGSSAPVWVRFDEFAGLFHFSRLYPMSLGERRRELANLLRAALEPYPTLAGIILAPSLWWVGETTASEAQERITHESGAVALRTPLPGHRARETFIVPRTEDFATQGALFATWYGDEQTWLDWALQECGQPPFAALAHEPT